MLEQDRYQYSPKLYTVGMIALMLFWFFILISLYIVPFLIWELHYDVPEFIIALQIYIQEQFEISITGSKWITFLIFLIPALINFIISSLVSTHIDKQLVLKKELAERTAVPITDAPHKEPILERPVGKEVSFATKVLLLMLVAIVILFGIEWLISVPPSQN